MAASLNLVQKLSGEGRSAELVRSGISVGGLKILSLAISLGTSVVLARGLGAAGFGRYSYVVSLVSVLSLPLHAGIPSVLVREIAKADHTGDWDLIKGIVRSSVGWTLIASVVVVLGALAYVWGTHPDGARARLLLLGIPLIPLMGFNAVRGGALRGLRYVGWSQVPETLVQPFVHMGLLVLLASLATLDPSTAIISLAISTAVAVVIGFLIFERVAGHRIANVQARYETSAWLKAWLPFTLLSAVMLFNAQITTLMLSWWSNDTEVGLMRVAERGAQLVGLSLTIVNIVCAPHIARAFHAKDQYVLQQLARKSVRVALAFALPIAVTLMVLGKPIIGLFYGEQYRDAAALPLASLCAAQVISVVFGSVGTLLNMAGYERDTLIGIGFGLVVNVIAGYVLIPRLGATGGAIAIGLSTLAWNGLLSFKVSQRMNIRLSPF